MRVDTALYDGYTIPEFYDSLIAKIIVSGENLEDARRRMVTALSEFSITGIKTTIPFHSALLQSEPFMKWDFSTDFVERTGIIEEMARRARAERQRIEEQGIAVAAAILTKGIHKVAELGNEERSGSRWGQSLPGRDGRFFDET